MRLRHCATSWTVACSVPEGVIWVFHGPNPTGRTMAPGSTQPLTEMSSRDITWGVKAAGGNLYADFRELLGVATSWIPKGLSNPVMRWPFTFFTRFLPHIRCPRQTPCISFYETQQQFTSEYKLCVQQD